MSTKRDATHLAAPSDAKAVQLQAWQRRAEQLLTDDSATLDDLEEVFECGLGDGELDDTGRGLLLRLLQSSSELAASVFGEDDDVDWVDLAVSLRVAAVDYDGTDEQKQARVAFLMSGAKQFRAPAWGDAALGAVVSFLCRRDAGGFGNEGGARVACMLANLGYVPRASDAAAALVSRWRKADAADAWPFERTLAQLWPVGRDDLLAECARRGVPTDFVDGVLPTRAARARAPAYGAMRRLGLL